MPRHQSKAQKDTIQRVMHEFKHGELERKGGQNVKNPKQAIAIALHEAGAWNYESPKKNKQNLRETKAKERHGQTSQARTEGRKAARPHAASKDGKTRAELYAEAKHRNIPGRSKMSKPDLERALHK
jgi:hypothetical protein